MNKKLIKNSLIFTIGDVLNKSIPFFMLPVLTRYLTPADYGVIAIFNVCVAILGVFTGLSVHGAVNVNYFKLEKKELKSFIGNCLFILSASTSVILLLGIICYPFFSVKIGMSIEWFIFAIIVSAAQFLTTINLTLWIVEERPKPYSIYQLSQTALLAVLSIILVVGFGMNYEGRLIAITIGTILFSFISLVFIIKRGFFTFKINRNHLIDALKFGGPLIPHQLSGWVKSGFDRLILATTLGASVTGVYSVAYQIAFIVDTLMASFNKVWGPYIMKLLASSPSFEKKKKVVITTYLLFLIILICAGVFSVLANYFIPIFLGEKFIGTIKYIPFFSTAFAFGGMYYVVVPYLFFTKKTHFLSISTSISAGVHLVALYFFTKNNGAIGAAYASMISFFTLFILTWYLSSRAYQMPWVLWKEERPLNENR